MVAGNANGRTVYVAIVTDVTRLLAGDVDEAGAGPADGEAGADPVEGGAVIDPAGADVKLIRPRSRLIWASSAGQSARRGPNTIALELDAGDTICFSAKSGSNNFEEAALIEDIGPADDSGALQDFTLVSAERNTVAPRDYDRIFPARFPEQEFWFWQCTAAAGGEAYCSVLLAVFDRDEQGRPYLAGHYRWTLQLTVTLTPAASSTHQGETS